MCGAHRGPVLALPRRRYVQHLAILRHRPPGHRVASLVQLGDEVLIAERIALAFLVDQLMELAGECSLPVSPQVILARSREEGFRYALKSESTVLLGTHRHFWRTEEERLARTLVSDGHKVALLHID